MNKQLVVANELEAPPPFEVEWRVSCGRRSRRVSAQLWIEARRKGALLLGVVPEACTCKRIDEKRLNSKAVA